jgi:hypothetical protein
MVPIFHTWPTLFMRFRGPFDQFLQNSALQSMERILVVYPQKGFMKTLKQIRKRLAHLAIGPLVGAIVAGLLLLVLMLNINNGKNTIDQRNDDKKFHVGALATPTLASNFG